MKFDYHFYCDTSTETVDLFEDIMKTKYDLEEIARRSSYMETKINICFWQHTNDNSECSKTALWLLESRPSFISPAHCYNNYVNAYVTDAFYYHFEKFDEDKISMGLRSAQVAIELQNTLISIKTGLDRLVCIFSKFYKCVSHNETFGRKKIKEGCSNPYKGFLYHCFQMKEKDEIFSFILSEYENWIADCVKPRDAIVHYQDFYNEYAYFSDINVIMPLSTNQIKNESVTISLNKLKSYVDKYYDFMDKIIKHVWKIELSTISKIDE